MTIASIQQGLVNLRQAMHDIHDRIAEVNYILTKNSTSDDEKSLAIVSLGNQLTSFRSLDDLYLAIDRDLHGLDNQFNSLLMSVLEIQRGEDEARNLINRAAEQERDQIPLSLTQFTQSKNGNGNGGKKNETNNGT